MDEFPMHGEGDLEIVKELVEGGMSVNSRDDSGQTPLHWAAEEGEYEVVDFLSSLPECDLNILDHEGRTPVLCAAERGNKTVVDLLLQRGAQVNCADDDKWTLLHHAAGYRWADLVRRILDQGEVDLNAATAIGETPLMLAATWGHEDVAALLIRAGADVNRSDAGKRTALHHAAVRGHTVVVQVLLKKEELDLNAQDEEGKTPLHWACRWGRREVMEQLLAAGADTTLKNRTGESALCEGIESGEFTFEDIRLFVEHCAFLQYCDYVRISQDPLLKEKVLKDASLCTRSIVNKFHRQSLPALKIISYFASKLPNTDKFKLNARQIDEVENMVQCEIARNTFCDVVKAHPMALSALCVLSLITCQPGMKRSASPDFGDSDSPLKKLHHN